MEQMLSLSCDALNYAAWTVIFLGRAASAFGTVMVNTPLA
jgi:hypothetical protein